MPGTDPYEAQFHDEPRELFDLRKSLNAVWRGKWLILLFGAVLAVLALLLVSRLDPRFTATTSVLFEPDRLQIIEFEGLLNDGSPQTNLGDKVEILGSNLLLTRVVEQVGLNAAPEEPEVAPTDGEAGVAAEALPAWYDGIPLISSFMSEFDAVSAEIEAEEAAAALSPEEQAADRTRRAVDRLRRNMAITQVRGSNVIDISITTGNPDSAAEIANAVSQQFIEAESEAARQEVQAVIDALNQRIAQLRERLDASEQAIAQARLELSERQAQSSEMTITQLNAMNAAVAALRLELTEAQARYERAADALDEDRDLWVVSEFRESELITAFREREIDVLEEIAKTVAISGENRSPARTVAVAQLEEIRRNIREEAGFIVEALRFEVASLREREAELEQIIRELEITRIGQTADELSIDRLEREAQATRNLYEAFADRVKEISEQSNLPTSSARVLSVAQAPRGPDRDENNLIVMAATVAGLFIGLLLVLVRERLNNAFQSPKELEDATGLKVLAALPQVRGRKTIKKLAANFMSKPSGLLAESVRSLRTAVAFADPDGAPQVVMMTSSLPNEGKTSTSLLLGLANQQMGKKTILLACDFRDRSNVRLFKDFQRFDRDSTTAGIASVVEGSCELEQALLVEPGSGLHILAISPNEKIKGSPADLLASDGFTSLMDTLRERYDAIILDTPPALLVTDARLMARVADAVVYLVRWNRTSRNAVTEGVREVAAMKVPIAGCVFTCVGQKKASKYADNEFLYKRAYSGYFR